MTFRIREAVRDVLAICAKYGVDGSYGDWHPELQLKVQQELAEVIENVLRKVKK